MIRFGEVSVQKVALWCVCMFVCAACGTVWSSFGGVSVQQVALWCLCVCVLRMGHCGTGVGE